MDWLISLMQREFSAHRIDAAVDYYLVGHGRQTFDLRAELAEAFQQKAGASELAERIRQRILCVTSLMDA
ncbi:MAG: hypothetical protein WA850_18495 [Xanthobacteraceae bacterium]